MGMAIHGSEMLRNNLPSVSARTGELQKSMKKIPRIVSLIFLILAVIAAHAAAADTTSTTSTTTSSSSTTTSSASNYVSVSSVTMDPEVFYPSEMGTITITVKNTGDEAVGLSNANILSDNLDIVKKDNWQTMNYIGTECTVSYTFQVVAGSSEGTYFGLFSVERKGGETLHYPLVITIDAEDIKTGISRKPETFTISGSSAVNLSIINPRDGAVKDIVVTTKGTNLDVTPSQTYISSLAAHSSAEIPFAVTPYQESNLTFVIQYQNGQVDKITEVVLPITVGHDKTAAVPTVNNLALTSQGSTFDLTGDITNTGISDANGLVVSVGSPAKGAGTYPEYAVGSLASDDSSSFEVTFTSSDISSVPLIIHWKDTSGTDYSVSKTLDLTTYSAGSGGMSLPSSSSSTSGTSKTSSGNAMMQGGPVGMGGPGGQPGGSSSSSVLSSITNAKGGISSFYPVIAMFVLIIVGAIAYRKRRWIMTKLKKQ